MKQGHATGCCSQTGWRGAEEGLISRLVSVCSSQQSLKNVKSGPEMGTSQWEYQKVSQWQLLS